jgi:hypothetical protein
VEFFRDGDELPQEFAVQHETTKTFYVSQDAELYIGRNE